MTRLSLQQTCLLEVSGELGKKARAQLQEHIAKYPAALLEYELTRGKFDLLKSMPSVDLSPASEHRIRDAIKAGMHRKLRQIERDQKARKRSKIIYAMMAGVTSVAACLAIAGGVYLVQQNIQSHDLALKDAVNQFEEVASSTPNATDKEYGQVASAITKVEQSHARPAPASAADRKMLRLLDELDAIKDTPSPMRDPGSL